jgi:hypothetical protein
VGGVRGNTSLADKSVEFVLNRHCLGIHDLTPSASPPESCVLHGGVPKQRQSCDASSSRRFTRPGGTDPQVKGAGAHSKTDGGPKRTRMTIRHAHPA